MVTGAYVYACSLTKLVNGGVIYNTSIENSMAFAILCQYPGEFAIHLLCLG